MEKQLNFAVVEIDNGFIFQTSSTNLAFQTAKELVVHIREFLGLPQQGRPKLEEALDNVVALNGATS